MLSLLPVQFVLPSLFFEGWGFCGGEGEVRGIDEFFLCLFLRAKLIQRILGAVAIPACFGSNQAKNCRPFTKHIGNRKGLG